MHRGPAAGHGVLPSVAGKEWLRMVEFGKGSRRRLGVPGPGGQGRMAGTAGADWEDVGRQRGVGDASARAARVRGGGVCLVLPLSLPPPPPLPLTSLGLCKSLFFKFSSRLLRIPVLFLLFFFLFTFFIVFHCQCPEAQNLWHPSFPLFRSLLRDLLLEWRGLPPRGAAAHATARTILVFSSSFSLAAAASWPGNTRVLESS